MGNNAAADDGARDRQDSSRDVSRLAARSQSTSPGQAPAATQSTNSIQMREAARSMQSNSLQTAMREASRSIQNSSLQATAA
ncbi:hypothetical protein, partial [Streptomyces antimycoticus]